MSSISVEKNEVTQIQSADDNNSLIETLLSRRGLSDPDEIEKFLSPDYEAHLHDPMLMKDMDNACRRIVEAIEKDERIVVYNDYDCDGIPGGVILHDFFKRIGFKSFFNYMPHRYREGYGLKSEAIEQFAKDGASLMITVDCGITDSEEIELAKELGIDTIITDHHLPIIDSENGKQIIPNCVAVLDSKRVDDGYPFKELCGAGVAFKLVQAILEWAMLDESKSVREHYDINKGWEKWLLDMAGIATIADMVPLVGENRVLAYYGLKVLQRSRRPGLQQLFKLMKVSQPTVSEDDVGFMIAPRVNAASRLSEPIEAFNMLASTDLLESSMFAEGLHKLNDRRKGLVAAMIREAKGRLEERFISGNIPNVVLVGDSAWNPGLLGLAANNLTENYGRPFFVWGRMGGEYIKGSCRSDGTVNIVDLMSAVEQGIFADFGGHEQAGGFSISTERVHVLEEALNKAMESIELIDISSKAQGVIDAELALDDVSWDVYRGVASLAPFGMGNPKPIFLFKKVEIYGVKYFGRDKTHLELIFRDSSGKLIKAIEFFSNNIADRPELNQGSVVNLTASMECSYFLSRPELRLRVVDIHKVAQVKQNPTIL